MQTNILEYLEKTAARGPDKTAYADDKTALPFREVYENSRSIGSFLSARGIYREPVVVFMKKTPAAVAAAAIRSRTAWTRCANSIERPSLCYDLR